MASEQVEKTVDIRSLQPDTGIEVITAKARTLIIMDRSLILTVVRNGKKSSINTRERGRNSVVSVGQGLLYGGLMLGTVKSWRKLTGDEIKELMQE